MELTQQRSEFIHAISLFCIILSSCYSTSKSYGQAMNNNVDQLYGTMYFTPIEALLTNESYYYRCRHNSWPTRKYLQNAIKDDDYINSIYHRLWLNLH